jgi:hypothetical protein
MSAELSALLVGARLDVIGNTQGTSTLYIRNDAKAARARAEEPHIDKWAGYRCDRCQSASVLVSKHQWSDEVTEVCSGTWVCLDTSCGLEKVQNYEGHPGGGCMFRRRCSISNSPILAASSSSAACPPSKYDLGIPVPVLTRTVSFTLVKEDIASGVRPRRSSSSSSVNDAEGLPRGTAAYST